VWHSENVPDDRVLVVIPALNEEASVGDVIKQVGVVLPDAHIVVVDDGSTDRTRDVAMSAGADVISLPFNLGVGGALRAGFRYAVRYGYTVAVQVDADGQHDPGEIPALLAALDEADLVIGARFAGAGEYAVRGARRLAMRMLAHSLSRRTSAPLSDTTSGFRAFNRRTIETFARDYAAEYLGDTVEALIIAAKAGLRVTQVPVAMRPRQAGDPKQGRVKSTLYLGRVVLALAMSRLRR
jgi:glycosyltransferase involved in cell wall biosynthesis